MKFRGGYKEINFSAENEKCTFDVAIIMLNNFTKKNYTINAIKEILIDIYKNIYMENKDNLLTIVSEYGKVGDDKT